MTLTCYGAAGGVTGSKYLLDTSTARVLLDCGIVQGPGSGGKNHALPFAAGDVDAVVVSHAHADHTGMLPVLVRAGYRGSIYATEATRDVMRLILEDAAHIAAEEAAMRKKKQIGDPASWEPPYTLADVTRVMERVTVLPYARQHNGWHDIAPGVRCKLYDAGHILGSSIVVIDLSPSSRGGAGGGGTDNRKSEINDRKFRFCFSGDLGPTGAPMLRDPEVPDEACDVLLMEATYGNETHEPFDAAIAKLADAMRRGFERGGVVLVPAFSLGRTQLLLYLLHRLMDRGEIPRMPIVVDSPLATDLTQVYERYAPDFDRETAADFPSDGHDPLRFQPLSFARTTEDSKALNDRRGPFAIISASGMMTNGRIVHHLRHRLDDPKNLVLITGFQAEGTTGRLLQDGVREVEILDERIPVNAEVIAFDAFSAHADAPQLAAWAARIPGVRHAILVHAEPDARSAFAAALARAHPNWKIDQPTEGEEIAL